MSLRSKLAQIPAYWTARRRAVLRSDRPFVSITFDDYPRTALEVGGRLLEAEGIAATYYVAFGLAGTMTSSGPVGAAEELAACVKGGHEIGCHTHDHIACATVSARDVGANLSHNRSVAQALGLPALTHFAYPFGQFSAAAKSAAMKSYASARTTKWGVNRGDIDLGLLKSVPLYSHLGRGALEPYFVDIERNGGWLILYTHDVAVYPSVYGCTPDDLAYAVGRARQAGANPLTVGGVVQNMEPMSASDAS
ncbi:MAG: polysaccharide deacetylase family protein [Rhizomicrobium sp.]|jgi:peptidoglycan/xylan/chitin deacetylase (PgdA/CDA1 family)